MGIDIPVTSARAQICASMCSARSPASASRPTKSPFHFFVSLVHSSVMPPTPIFTRLTRSIMGICLAQPMDGSTSVKEACRKASRFRTRSDSMESCDMYGPVVSISSKRGEHILRLGILLMRPEDLGICINVRSCGSQTVTASSPCRLVNPILIQRPSLLCHSR